MIFWTIKLLNNVRKAIAGRKHPYQLAWAVAFGLVLGIVPHGNLVALVWLVLVLSLNLNHSMAVVTAVGASFLGGYVDPYSHQVGNFLMQQPRFYEGMVKAWQWPMVPWTDLNNTVVLGSLVIGLVAMVPTFLVAYPVFRYLGNRLPVEENNPGPDPKASHEVLLVDQGHAQASYPHRVKTADRRSTFAPIAVDVQSAPEPETLTNPSKHVAVETRIDVIRISDYQSAKSTQPSDANSAESTYTSGDVDSNEPMDEAFRYLLRQLRDSKQRKAA